jgi:sulfate/thiosulfate transport system permease protein
MADLAVAAPRRLALPRLTAGLGPGVSLIYLSIMVVLPVAALTSQAAHGSFWGSITTAPARSALELTVGASIITALIDSVTGVALAWVLVRDDFPGKGIVNALIDLPFALPTIVAGLVLITLYGQNSPIGVNLALTRYSVVLALMFVTLPFVTRAVQPVLLSLEKDVEDAAACLGATPWTTFRRITFPAILPAVVTGAGLAFARGLGEFGAVQLISGNLPGKTVVSSVYIDGLVESGDAQAAAAESITLLALALVVLICVAYLTRRWTARRG